MELIETGSVRQGSISGPERSLCKEEKILTEGFRVDNR